MISSNHKHALLYRLLPFTRWAGEWRDITVVRADVIAGITVALVLIPQSMAYAQLAGLPAYYGLYAAFIPPAVAAVFGSSRQLATGPVAMASLITAATLLPLASPGSSTYIGYAVLLALMVGVMRIAMGMLRLGALINFLSHPVVLGFANAAALIIASSQLHSIFGVSVMRGDYHYQTVWRIIVALAENIHWPTFSMALLAMGIMVGMRYAVPKSPYVLIAAVITSLIAWAGGYTGEVVGAIPAGLPALSVPRIESAVLPKLFMGSLTITLIGLMEAMSIAKNIAAHTRQRLDINQELIGQGLANVVGSFFKVYPVSGSFSRSAVNFNSGAKTGFSSVVTSLVVMVVLLWCTPLLFYLPQATLAAIIIVAVISLIRIKPLITAWKINPADAAIAVITFVTTLVFAPALHVGILTGISLSLIFYLYCTMRPRVADLSRHPDGSLRDADVYGLQHCQHISIIRFDGELYFGNCSYFEDKVLELVASKPDLKCVIIDSGGINNIDASGEEMLRAVVTRLNTSGIEVLFSRAKKQLTDTLERSGFVYQIGTDRFFRWNQHALEKAWAVINCDHLKDCPLYTPVPAAEHDNTHVH
jgi:SulP family sulfate permease